MNGEWWLNIIIAEKESSLWYLKKKTPFWDHGGCRSFPHNWDHLGIFRTCLILGVGLVTIINHLYNPWGCLWCMGYWWRLWYWWMLIICDVYVYVYVCISLWSSGKIIYVINNLDIIFADKGIIDFQSSWDIAGISWDYWWRWKYKRRRSFQR